jgi:agmatine deiminase
MLCWNEKHKQVLVPLISQISKHEEVHLFYNENYHHPGTIIAQLAGSNANLDHIFLIPFQLEKDNIWIRDYGPTFVRDKYDNTQIIGFAYPHQKFTDYQNFAQFFSERMRLPFQRSGLYSVGGGREVNGRGTIILIEGYEKIVNPGMSKAEIEAEYHNQLGQNHVIWLKRGIPQDDFLGFGPVLDNIYGYGTNWHIDEFCRFANAQTILLAEVSPQDIARHPFYQLVHDRLEENYQILRQATDQDGHPFQIIRVPQAPVFFAAGHIDTTSILYTPVTSYLNFALTNKSVIVPTYYDEEAPEYVRLKDQEAIEKFQQIFPTREILTVNALDLNYDGGGLHCVTLPTPKKRTKRLRTLFQFRQKLG